jgi:type IV secretory pathway protease TraF
MVVRGRRIRGLGVLGQSASSYVHVRAIDKEGKPITDTLVFLFRPGTVAAEERVRTNGGGWAIIPARGFPVGSPAELAVELPEGTARRATETRQYASGHVEVFQSVTTLPELIVTAAEAVGFGLGLVLSIAGLHVKDHGAQKLVVGLGSGVFAVSGFSLIFRHLR